MFFYLFTSFFFEAEMFYGVEININGGQSWF